MKYLLRKWWFWLWMVANGIIIRYQMWQVDKLREKLFGGE